MQYYDLTVGGNPHSYFRGGLQSEDHRIVGRLTGAPTMVHPISVLRGGVDIRFHDGTLRTISWDGDGD